MKIYFGGFGTDAGGWYFDGKKFHRVPGWNPEQLKELQHAVAALREIGQIKTAGVAEHLAAALHEVVSKEISAHVKGEGEMVVFI